MSASSVRARPRVSVVMPVYNGARFLQAALESVLAQTFHDFEFIAVDDGSIDETSSILNMVEDSRMVRLRHERNRGLVAALNTGLESARGDLIAIQHADDTSDPNRIALQVALFDACPELVVAGSAWELTDEAGVSIGMKRRPTGDTALRWMSLFLTPFGHPTVMFRGELARQHGLRYEQTFYPAEDYRMWSRMLEYGRGANIDRPLVRYRVHESQITSSTWDESTAIAERIALSNLRALGLPVELDDVKRLRPLAVNPPRRLQPDDFRLLALLLRANRNLSRRAGVDTRHTRATSRILIDTALGSMFRGSYRNIRRSGALRELVRSDPLWFATAPLRKIFLRGRRDGDANVPGQDLAAPASRA